MPAALLRIGTRGSALARWQAEWVADQLRQRGHTVELTPITTRGDVDQHSTMEQIAGGEGVFTKELQRALLDRRIDLAVHSLKDLPTDPVAGLILAAVPPREDCFDVLVSRDGRRLDELPSGSVIGTGSLRRQAQLRHARPDLKMIAIRGNVDTRLRKLRDGEMDALVLAAAGLHRLGRSGEMTQVLPPSLMLPAVGQGALGIEIRADDLATRAAVDGLDDPPSRQAVTAERAMLTDLRGGCLAPIGAWARIESDTRLHLSAVVLSADGRECVTASASAAPTSDAASAGLGRRVAELLLAQGAADLISASRHEQAPP